MVLQFSFIFFRRNLIAIFNNFMLYINNIQLAKILIFTILNSLKITVYKTRCYLSINENCKDYRFIYNMLLYIMLKFIDFVRSKIF